MSDQLAGALIGIITTIIGGVFGFLLSEIGAARREEREITKRNRAVRLIVGLEVERNLTALKALWAAIKAKDYDPAQTSPGNYRRDMARVFVEKPLMPFSRESLDAQLPTLPSALPYGTLSQLFGLYDTLSQVETIRKDLVEAMADQQGEMTRFRQSQTAPGQTPGLLYAPRTPFDNKAALVWDGLSSAIQTAIETGNPIKPEKADSATKSA